MLRRLEPFSWRGKTLSQRLVAGAICCCVLLRKSSQEFRQQLGRAFQGTN